MCHYFFIQQIFGMFLLQAMYITVHRIVTLSNTADSNGLEFLHKQFCRLAISVNHMFKSGKQSLKGEVFFSFYNV